MEILETKTQSNDVGAPSAVESNEGNAGIVSDSEQFKPCPHRYCGCISQNGYVCLHNGPCEPVDENGRRFAVSYTKEAGQTFMHKTPVPLARTGNKATCGNRCMCQPENHGGTGACGKSLEIPQVVSADDLQAALASTMFADTEPFDAKKFVTDVIGS